MYMYFQNEITLNADESENIIMAKLRLEMDLPDVKVTKSGTCYGYDYDLEWTQTSGDLPTMGVSQILILFHSTSHYNTLNMYLYVYYGHVYVNIINLLEECTLRNEMSSQAVKYCSV